MADQYFFEKYELIDEWTDVEPEENIVDEKEITTDEITEETINQFFHKDAAPYFESIGFANMRKLRYEYKIKIKESYGSYNDYELALEEPIDLGDVAGVYTDINYPWVGSQKDGNYGPPENYSWVGDWQTNVGGVFGVHRAINLNPNILYEKLGENELREYEVDYYRVLDARSGSSFSDFSFDIFEGNINRKIKLDTKITIYRIQKAGEFIETIVADDGTYPEDGPQDGFWWVKKGRYTYPAPELISPEVNYKAKAELPYFVFKLFEREEGDNRQYHARLRFGERSDLGDQVLVKKTAEDTTGWEYYNETAEEWQDYPEGGIEPETKVRYNLTEEEVELFGFGFYYWDATAFYEQEYGHGLPSQSRAIIIMVETDEVYELDIGGKKYKTDQLSIIETSNGEIGKIELRLINHSF